MNKKNFGAFFDQFFNFLKMQKSPIVGDRRPIKFFKIGFLAMGGGLKYQKRIKTQLLRTTALKKVHIRKYNSFFRFQGQYDPPWSTKG